MSASPEHRVSWETCVQRSHLCNTLGSRTNRGQNSLSDRLPGRGALVAIVGEELGIAVLLRSVLRLRGAALDHPVQQLSDQPERVDLVLVLTRWDG